MSLHYAKYANSDRLKRLINFLSDACWHSTRECVMGAEVMAVNSAMDELRENGFSIEHRQVGKIHEYRWWTKAKCPQCGGELTNNHCSCEGRGQ